MGKQGHNVERDLRENEQVKRSQSCEVHLGQHQSYISLLWEVNRQFGITNLYYTTSGVFILFLDIVQSDCDILNMYT